MPNLSILQSVSAAWAKESGKVALDLSCGGGHTAIMLAKLGYRVVATEYGHFRPMPHGILSVGGVDLNAFLPFKASTFDAIDVVEVIEHIENQPQLIREIARLLK